MNAAALEAEVKRLEAELERKRLEEQLKQLEAQLAKVKAQEQEAVEDEYIEEEIIEEDEYIEEEIIEEEIIDEGRTGDANNTATSTTANDSTSSPTAPKSRLNKWFGRGGSKSATATTTPSSAPPPPIADEATTSHKAAAVETISNEKLAGFATAPPPPLPAVPFKARVIPNDPSEPSPTGEETPIEKLLGSHLYAGGKLIRRTTLAAMKDQELLMLYFGNKWNRECKGFFPSFMDFYCTCAQANKMECVYVSTDRSLADFKEIFAKMPWPAMTTGTSSIKNELAKQLKVIDIPTVCVLEVTTGHVITTHAMEDISALQRNNVDQANELVETWRKIVPIPLDQVVMDKRLKHGKMERHTLYWQE